MKRPVACWLMTLVLTSPSAGASDAQEPDVTTPVQAATAKPETPADFEALAIRTLREHLANPAADVEVLGLAPIEWPDSSIGCPRPDFSYKHVITPGHLAVLGHDGKTYRVHMAGKRAFVCERSAQVAKEKVPTVDIQLSREHLETLARTDYARRLGVPVEQVTVTDAQPKVWQNLSLGCPEAGQSYKAVPVKGYLLELTYHGRKHLYHTDRYRVLPCPPFYTE